MQEDLSETTPKPRIAGDGLGVTLEPPLHCLPNHLKFLYDVAQRSGPPSTHPPPRSKLDQEQTNSSHPLVPDVNNDSGCLQRLVSVM